MTDVCNQPSRFTAWRLFVLLEVANRDAVAEEIDKRANSNSATTTIMTRLRWGAFFLVLLFLVIQLIPRALGQRDASKRSSDVEIPLPKQQPAPLEPAVCSSWTATGSLNTGRTYHTATLLPNGTGAGCKGDLIALNMVSRARNCSGLARPRQHQHQQRLRQLHRELLLLRGLAQRRRGET
jgi:hypothetical protein